MAKKQKTEPPTEEHTEWCFEIGQRVKHYGSGAPGTIRSREIRTDPMYGDESEYYLLEFDAGRSGFFFDRQLENFHEGD